MSFNINNTNFQCAPMYNQNKNNQVIGYLCSTSKNVEGFGGLVDRTNSSIVKSKDTDGQYFGYLGGVKIISSNVGGDQTRTLNLNLEDRNGSKNSTLLNRLISEFRVNNTLPFIFHFNKEGTFYVFRTYDWSINGNTLTLNTPQYMINIDDFNELKNLSGVLELRVGIYDINNKSQRDNVRSVWER